MTHQHDTMCVVNIRVRARLPIGAKAFPHGSCGCCGAQTSVAVPSWTQPPAPSDRIELVLTCATCSSLPFPPGQARSTLQETAGHLCKIRSHGSLSGFGYPLIAQLSMTWLHPKLLVRAGRFFESTETLSDPDGEAISICIATQICACRGSRKHLRVQTLWS